MGGADARFGGQVCVVTGAAGAIGSATARSFAAAGASLALADVAPIDEGIAGPLADGAAILTRSVDVTDPAAARGFVEEVVERFGRVDVLVNVAGIVSHGAAHDLAADEWDRVLRVNLTGTFRFCQAVMAPMKRQRYGRIVNLGSVVGLNGGNPRPWIDPSEQGAAGNVAYGVSKAGVHSLTAFLAKELAADGITVNAVAPGPVATGMTTSLPQTLKALIPVGRMGTPEEIAEAILFLSSPTAGYITGEILDVNGGIVVG